MTKFKVLVPLTPTFNDLPDHLPEFKQFQKDFDVHIEHYENSEQVINDLKTKHNDIAAIYETSALLRLGGYGKFLEHLPESLKVVSIPWVGANAFDLKALRDRGITLTNAGDIPAHDVADIALNLILSVFRFTSFFERGLREAEGDINQVRKAIGSLEYDQKGNPIPRENTTWAKDLLVAGQPLVSPKGKVAGIVGLGAIGKEIATRLNVIGSKIKYTKRTPLSDEEAKKLNFDVEFVESFEELAPQVDLLVLAVPESSETINLVNKDTFKLFKKGVRIVNIGRGSAIDEDALFEALDDHTVAAFGSDVFLNEPNIDKRFLRRPNVSILPHLGSFTVDTLDDSAIVTIDNIKNVLYNDGEGAYIVN